MDNKITLNLVGIQYRDNYEDLLNRIDVGTPVILKPEPTNPHDPNALAFYLEDGTILGYLPQKDQPFAQIFLAQGYIKAVVSNIDEDENWIDTEALLTPDMVDDSMYKKSDVKINKITSCGDNIKSQNVELMEIFNT